MATFVVGMCRIETQKAECSGLGCRSLVVNVPCCSDCCGCISLWTSGCRGCGEAGGRSSASVGDRGADGRFSGDNRKMSCDRVSSPAEALCLRRQGECLKHQHGGGRLSLLPRHAGSGPVGCCTAAHRAGWIGPLTWPQRSFLITTRPRCFGTNLLETDLNGKYSSPVLDRRLR